MYNSEDFPDFYLDRRNLLFPKNSRADHILYWPQNPFSISGSIQLDLNSAACSSVQIQVQEIGGRFVLFGFGFGNQFDRLRGTGRCADPASDAALSEHAVFVCLFDDRVHWTALIRTHTARRATVLIDGNHEVALGHYV